MSTLTELIAAKIPEAKAAKDAARRDQVAAAVATAICSRPGDAELQTELEALATAAAAGESIPAELEECRQRLGELNVPLLLSEAK